MASHKTKNETVSFLILKRSFSFPALPAELLRCNLSSAKPILRIFAYGDANARGRAKLHIPDWDDKYDIFAA